MFNKTDIKDIDQLDTPFYYYDLGGTSPNVGGLPRSIIKIRFPCALCHEGQF